MLRGSFYLYFIRYATYDTEKCLRLWVDSLSQYPQFHQDNFGEDIADDVEERDAVVIVTVATVILVLVESDYVGIFYVL